MKTTKAILLSTVCLFGYADDAYSANYPAWEASSLISTSGIHTYHTQHNLTDEFLFSPHFALSVNRHNLSLPLSRGSWRGYESRDLSLLSLAGLIPSLTLPTSERGLDSAYSEREYNEASVCFITDTGACVGGDRFSGTEDPGSGNGKPDYKGPQDQCVAAGYDKHPCPAGSHGDNLCPLDSSYSMKCVCDANMTETCNPPYYGVGPSCDGKYASCKRDDERACRELGYSQTGACSSVQTINKRCPYNNTYYDKCVCRSDLVTCTSPQTGVGSSCGGKYASCQCPSSYKSCECGGASGATSCTVNGVTKYSSCKDCCNSSNPRWCSVHGTCHGDCCSDGSIEACDARCGGSGCCSPKKDETGCTHGTYSCSDGCGGYRDCCKICDPEDRNCNCPGKVYCGDTKTGSGASCTSGGKTFYETCLVKETCIEQNLSQAYVAPAGSASVKDYTYIRPYCTTQTGVQMNLYATCWGRYEGVSGKCAGKKNCPGNLGHQNNGSTEPCICRGAMWFDSCDDSCSANDYFRSDGGYCGGSYYTGVGGWYYIGERCTTLTGQKVYNLGRCDYHKDCEGNKGPCYGKKRCTGGTIAVDPCTCGGVTYGSSCVIKCPYEQTAADCSSGQTFTQRCKDNVGTWYGECK